MVDELGFSIVHEHGFFNPPPAFLDQLVDAMGLTAAGGVWGGGSVDARRCRLAVEAPDRDRAFELLRRTNQLVAISAIWADDAAADIARCPGSVRPSRRRLPRHALRQATRVRACGPLVGLLAYTVCQPHGCSRWRTTTSRCVTFAAARDVRLDNPRRRTAGSPGSATRTRAARVHRGKGPGHGEPHRMVRCAHSELEHARDLARIAVAAGQEVVREEECGEVLEEHAAASPLSLSLKISCS